MNAYNSHHCATAKWILMTLGVSSVLISGRGAVEEPKFAVLQVGTQTYSNVTVTTKAKRYVFIQHAGGMTSLKPAELPLDVQLELGYGPPKPATNTAAAWARKEIAKINNVPQIKELGKQLDQKWSGKGHPGLKAIGLLGPKLIFAVLGITLLIYLFQC